MSLGVGSRASVWTAVTEQSAVTALRWDGRRDLRTSDPPHAIPKRRLPQNPVAALQNLAARGGVPSSPQRLESGDGAKAGSVDDAERPRRVQSPRGGKRVLRDPSGLSGIPIRREPACPVVWVPGGNPPGDPISLFHRNAWTLPHSGQVTVSIDWGNNALTVESVERDARKISPHLLHSIRRDPKMDVW